MRPCRFEDFKDKNITNLDQVADNWFNRLCPKIDENDDQFKVLNSKFNKSQRNGFNIEVTDCQLQSGCVTSKPDI